MVCAGPLLIHSKGDDASYPRPLRCGSLPPSPSADARSSDDVIAFEGQLMAVATGSLDSTTGEPVLYLVERASELLLRIHPWRAAADAGSSSSSSSSIIPAAVTWTVTGVLAIGLFFAARRVWHRGGYSKRNAMCRHMNGVGAPGSAGDLGSIGGGDDSDNLRDRYKLLVPKEWLRDTTF